ncbi:RNA polymerase sigma-H factor [Paenibacillus auburnensis]|uniref:RNA polymerase sigma-H factor n=1 Tax=Paenibacillus auburnensis TaxID=2905649 RepID=A0ABN8GTW5_9BACL|nr:RNA polymerase sigma factor [Paenibacillus auburnensis]CAH1217926.1 RNA polymerase sigma-H factor [Paenibacillus auburnensis]
MEEAEWISAALSGQSQAFGHLVTRYQGMVYRVCIKITGEAESAKDMAQEVFIKAYKALPSFRGQSSFSTWLYRIAYRTCLDWKRANDREWRHRSTADYTENDWVTSQTPEHVALRKEASEELDQNLNSLTEPYRSVVQLYYFQRHSYQEIAEQKGVSVKTVESQLYRARQMMRKSGEEWR